MAHRTPRGVDGPGDDGPGPPHGPPPDLRERAADVAAAMRALDRAAFLPAAQRRHAHEDRALPLGHGSTGSQPSTVAAMLRLLAVPVGARVLDVGAGSGWTTALLAHLVGPTGEVLGLELEPAVAAWGAGNLAAAGTPWARLEPADPDVLGRPRPGGWDRVLVSAAAPRLPVALVDQLAPGGVLVVPVVRTMHRVVRHPDGSVEVTTHGSYVFVPLR
ncbi:protein-L-isoaspartate carboxylmethyltransferase [Cellulomonas sp. JZ18]|uniref:protein-L-isoaspartate O-methyltransferase family protein n=1 Tax=Cellulomonas sp. JZ18 TaxID=2654191 RepID=UPI0012D3D066|nr:protein-L-isoaspartate carboxylmethyltransferase [Cellulomonas sp. JZ18]QGQ20388.1 protein-L-isoaspartate carboxylmethyltransferase [Cellulomonas sp. JZ18]